MAEGAHTKRFFARTAKRIFLNCASGDVSSFVSSVEEDKQQDQSGDSPRVDGLPDELFLLEN